MKAKVCSDTERVLPCPAKHSCVTLKLLPHPTNGWVWTKLAAGYPEAALELTVFVCVCVCVCLFVCVCVLLWVSVLQGGLLSPLYTHTSLLPYLSLSPLTPSPPPVSPPACFGPSLN